MLSLFTNKYLIGGIALALIIGGLYAKGRIDGRAAVLAKAQEELTEQLQERGMTDAEIQAMSDSDKCELIGGMWDNGFCQ